VAAIYTGPTLHWDDALKSLAEPIVCILSAGGKRIRTVGSAMRLHRRQRYRGVTPPDPGANVLFSGLSYRGQDPIGSPFDRVMPGSSDSALEGESSTNCSGGGGLTASEERARALDTVTWSVIS
jgi:hypothetical protein